MADEEGRGPRIAIVAGEASGDALGALLIDAVRDALPDVRFAGIAGPRMRAAGCEPWHAASELAVRGYVEVVRHLPRLTEAELEAMKARNPRSPEEIRFELEEERFLNEGAQP